MKKLPDLFVLALLALSLAANVYLYRQLPSTIKPVSALARGQHVPELVGKDSVGQPLRFSYAQRPAILYTFSPSCIWCARNLNNARLLASATAQSYDFLAIPLDERGLDAYLAKNELHWTVVRGMSEELRKSYGLGGTPETIVIGVGGMVQNVWMGGYTATVMQDIRQTLGIQLPGLDMAAQLDRP